MRLFIVIFILASSITNGQTKLTKAQVDSLPNTIENQFVKIYKKSSDWKEYRMVKKADFLDFQKKVLDSVALLRENITTKQKKIEEQVVHITALNSQISELNTELTAFSDKSNIKMSKSTYNNLLWAAILLLFVALVFSVIKFRESNVITKEKIKSYNEIEEEFEQFRKKTLEKEQKLRRQLHDEVNKNRN